MRSVIFVALVLGTALTCNAQIEGLFDKTVLENCLKEVDLSFDAFENALKSGFKDADEKIKCLASCGLKAKELMKDDGTLDVEKAIQAIPDIPTIPKDKITKSIQKCGSIKADNDCNTAHNIFVCLWGELKP